jgi:hypothetical protein
LELTPTIAAVVNGLLAAVVGALGVLTTPRRRGVYTAVLVVIAGVVVIAAVVGEYWKDRADEERLDFLTHLDKQFAAGQHLFEDLVQGKIVDEGALQNWVTVTDLELSEFDSGLSARFEADVGMTTLTYNAAAHDPSRNTALNFVSHRLQRLDFLIDEIARAS